MLISGLSELVTYQSIVEVTGPQNASYMTLSMRHYLVEKVKRGIGV